MPSYYFAFILLVVFAIFFYRAGEFEGSSGMVWAGISVLISILIWRWLGWGLLGMILGQIGLFVGIGIVRALRKS
jgi:hypothetical protein